MTNEELREKWELLHQNPQERNGLRPEIKDSWERSYDFGINPRLRENPYICTDTELKQYRDNSGYLVEASRSVMKSLMEFVAGTGFVGAMADPNLCLLEVIGDEQALSWARSARLIKGSMWSEELVGTNAGAMAVALAKPISVFGFEHFCLFSHVAACSVSPIMEQGRIIGALGLLAPFNRVNNHTLGMVVAAARHIKSKMALEGAIRYHEVVMDSMSEGLLTIDLGGNITYTNENCARIFHFQRESVIGRNIFDLFGHSSENHYFINKVIQGKVIADENFTLTIGREVMHCNVTCNPFSNPDPGSGGFVIIFRESHRINRLVRNYIGGGAKMTFDDIKGKDSRFMHALKTAQAASSSISNVLLLGESGTGKDIIAQAMHNASPRKNSAYLALNCAALPRDLIASELFGFEDGAFTGARKGGNVGKFELADQGTILLDEIGDMPLDLQASLLRVLEEKTIMRLGGTKVIPVNVRVIAATNQDLEMLIEKNRFRRDLYYRLGVIKITIPPLRDRRDDIIMLARQFTEKTCKLFHKPLMTLAPEVIEAFLAYSWPGNIREMQNVIEGAIQLAPGHIITYDLVRDSLVQKDSFFRISEGKQPPSAGEKQMIIDSLARNQYNKTQTAVALGMSRRTLYRRLKKYGLLD